MRRILAVIAGAIAASIVLFITGYISNHINPTPAELMDPQNAETVLERVQTTSLDKWMAVIFGISLGSYVGSRVTIKITPYGKYNSVRVLTILLSIWSFYTFYIVYPNVLWVPIMMLGGTLLGAWLALRNR